MNAALVVTTLALSLGAATDPVPVTPGRWEVTVTMQMQGGEPSGSTTTRCIAPEDLADPEWVFTGENARAVAKLSKHKVTGLTISGNKVSYSVAPGPGLPPAQVSGTVSATSFKVERTVKGFPARTTIEGKRLGDCKK